MKNKLCALLMTLLMCSALLAGCGSSSTATTTTEADTTQTELSAEVEEDDWAYIQSKGTLVIGITIFEPMNYYGDDQELTGFDTEYAEAVCEKLGLTPEFIEINWDTKEIELNSKTIDCIWNGFTISEDKKTSLTYTTPYVKNMQVAVIQAANADTYTDAASLAGATVAYEAGSAGEEAANSELESINGISVAKQTDALTEVKAGTSDAAVLDYTLASAMVGEGTDYSDLMIIDGLELAVEEYGVGCRLDSTLVDQINAATEELIADGTLAALAEKYGLNLAE
jgi:polar amino acid transport system substrate-binding protein